MLKQYLKAGKWLGHKAGDRNIFPVVANRRGYAEFIAYVYRINREGKANLWFCVDLGDGEWPDTGIKQIKRICI